jgi:phage terminase large subunit
MALRWAQQEIVDATNRFKVVVAGRRFGKTHLAIRELCKHARHPDKTVWYVAPTYRQAKLIAWQKLKAKLLKLRWVAKINESELTIVLKNGSTIALKGADNADSLRGVGLDYLVLDEFAEMQKEAWAEVLRPTLADRQGGALFIGTPKGFSNWAHDMYLMEEKSKQWRSFQYTTIDGGNVALEEIEAARADLDERSFRQEFLATFEEYAGRVYYAFDRKRHVQEYTSKTPHTIYLGCDFNIDPMSAVLFSREGDVLHAFDEVRIFGSNTNELVDEVTTRYPRARIMAFPDPAGRQRKTSAGGVTDIRILQNAGWIVKANKAHTPIRDRINAVNSRLVNDAGNINLYVDPKCKHTIEGLEKQTYREGTSQPDKQSGLDHMMDALGYCVDGLFPIKRDYGDIEQPLRWGHKLG